MPNINHPIPGPIEAQHIYAALFRGPIPPILQDRFLAANVRLNAAADPQELAAYTTAIAATSDLEALELAARLTRRLPLLTRKLRLMAYLAETLPDHQRFYINGSSNFVRAALLIAWEGLTSILKALKGFWLLWRIGHA